MKKPVLVAFIIIIAMVLTAFYTNLGSASTQLSISIQSTGYVQQASTPTPTPTPTPTVTPTPTPTPTPTETYTYSMSVSGSNYLIKNSVGSTLKSSTSSSTTFNYLFGSSGIASTGSTVYINAGSYTVDSTWYIYKNVAKFTFSNAILTLANNVNYPVLYIDGVTGVTITGININGNTANQNIGSINSPNPCDGIVIWDSTNTLVDKANIDSCREFGYAVYGSSNNVGITNSNIANCGWNGIQIGYSAGVTNCYAKNNDVSHCSDVGITTFGTGSIIQNNSIHDITGNTGYSSSNWGIAVEGGNTATINGNTITNCDVDIATSATLPSASSNTITYNTLKSGSTALVYFSTNSNTFSYNILVQNSGIGLRIESGVIGTSITSNDFTSCFGVKISDSGKGTVISGNTRYP
jgi:hypothetical protein